MAVGLQNLEQTVSEALYHFQYGSDDFREDLRRNRGGVVLERYGIPVALRTWTQQRRWRLNLNGVTQSEIEQLQAWYERGAFYLKPNAIAATKYKVLWTGSFDPVYVAPDLYSLQALWVEMK